MSTQNLLIMVVAGVVVVGGGWFLVSQEDDMSSDDKEAMNDQVAEMEEMSGFGSLASLMGLGQNLTCDFNYSAPDAAGAVAGTVYVAGENIAADFEMEQAGEVYESHMIQDGNMAYTWTTSSQGTFAFKSEISEPDPEVMAEYAGSASGSSRNMDLSQEVDYDCRAWNVDSSKFVPPSDINFMSQQEMMMEAMSGIDMSQFQQ